MSGVENLLAHLTELVDQVADEWARQAQFEDSPDGTLKATMGSDVPSGRSFFGSHVHGGVVTDLKHMLKQQYYQIMRSAACI